MTTPALDGSPLIEATRGDIVESVHRVAACAVGPGGEVRFSLGEIEADVYLRSAAKPLISAVSVMAGVLERFGLTQPELSIMTASHSGEPFHIHAVRSILRKIGLDESALQCGADYPYDASAAAELISRGIAKAPVYHNCSGKHAGILALCGAIGADPSTYLEPDNPAQQRILAFCAAASGVPIERLTIAVDGCGIPVYAVPLHNSALAYMRIATLDGLSDSAAEALRRVRDAMIAYPEYMSGTGEFDAALIRSGGGNLICKGGAEGVHATALFDRGIGVVVKIVDGAERARPTAALAVLRAACGYDSHDAALDAFLHPALRNRAGRVVGEVRVREGALR